jgi:hypothetical protein
MLRTIRRPLPHIAMHIKKAPGVGTVLPTSRVCEYPPISSGVIRIVSNVILSPQSTPWSCLHGRHTPTALPWAIHTPNPQGYCRPAGIQTGEEFLDIIMDTFSTGRSGLFGQLLGVALKPSVFPVITASYWAWVTSYLPR